MTCDAHARVRKKKVAGGAVAKAVSRNIVCQVGLAPLASRRNSHHSYYKSGKAVDVLYCWCHGACQFVVVMTCHIICHRLWHKSEVKRFRKVTKLQWKVSQPTTYVHSLYSRSNFPSVATNGNRQVYCICCTYHTSILLWVNVAFIFVGNAWVCPYLHPPTNLGIDGNARFWVGGGKKENKVFPAKNECKWMACLNETWRHVLPLIAGAVHPMDLSAVISNLRMEWQG